MEDTQSSNSNKNAIRMGALLLSLIWVVVMNNILGTYDDVPSSGNQSATITQQVATTESPNILATQIEIDIADSIFKIDEIIENINNNQPANYQYNQILDWGIQEKYQELYETINIDLLTVSSDNIVLSGQDSENDFGYRFQYFLSGEFTKVTFTLGDPDAPYYSNFNNQEFTKITF